MMLHTKYQCSMPVDSVKIVSCCPYISLCKTCDPQGHYLNKVGRGLLGDATYQISMFYALLFHTIIFSCFPYISLFKTFETGDRANLAPGT